MTAYFGAFFNSMNYFYNNPTFLLWYCSYFFTFLDLKKSKLCCSYNDQEKNTLTFKKWDRWENFRIGKNRRKLYDLQLIFCLSLHTSVNIWKRTLFTKFLTTGRTQKLCNPLDGWLDCLIPANPQTDYIICMLTWDFKVWRIRT